MQFFIDLTEKQHDVIWRHLLPEGATQESAAFIFAEFHEDNKTLLLKAQDYFLVEQDGFIAQYDDYIELSDESRISIIKQAHQTNTALIELHSHPFDSPWSAAFSIADMNGFEETVPHMWWRLPGRPYAAIVVSPRGFDSLVWQKDPNSPECLSALRVDKKVLKPTGMTLGGKHVISK
ncbi:hypothetical protein OLMES_5230 [Oleiphilus messinensis]|uniref:JAB domain-containing protein n=1 Tax=Oleiphilus messinensis TaxID=141451 RepID=A0A1Y0IIJ1_9GAMM|nr:hypothetical protein [Oleiphilus messinensis]ARU59214.1 hypothetical protein OLMES_5230 [Oleiphilus messinensis]